MTNCRYSSLLAFLGLLAFLLGITQTCLGQPLAWDAETKEYTVKTNETHGHLFFSLTNVSSREVVISNVTTSCGCTVAKLPKKPWIIEPNESGRIDVEVDVRGKTGTITKQVSVASPTAEKLLTVSVTIPNGYFGGGM